MPIYEYKCNKCENKFTKLFLSNPDESSVTCDKCDSKDVARIFSSFAIGSGKGRSDILPCRENKSISHSCGSGCGCCPLGGE